MATRLLAPGLACAALGWVSCMSGVSCMPAASFRPAGSLADPALAGDPSGAKAPRAELGGGGVVVGPRPFVDEPARASGQLWGAFRLGPHFTITGVSAFDASAIAVGGALRWNAVRASRFAMGVEGEGGFAWVGAGLPLAFRLFDQTWLYTSPRMAFRLVDAVLTVPVGLSVRIFDGFMLRAEYGASWVDLQRAQRRNFGGLALAVAF